MRIVAKDILYMLKLGPTLISIGRIAQAGHTVQFCQNAAYLTAKITESAPFPLSMDYIVFRSQISFEADFPGALHLSDVMLPVCFRSLHEYISSMFLYKLSQDFQQYFASEPANDLNKPLVINNAPGINSNLLQGVYVTVCLDLRNPSPNNFCSTC
jgi:hypothetical protein